MSSNKFKVVVDLDNVDSSHILRVTHNGYQWSAVGLRTLEELEAVATAAINYVLAARQHQPTAAGENAESNKK